MDFSTENSGHANVYESKATYYNPAVRRWEDGTFTINKDHFQFVTNNSNNDQFHLCLPLSTISGLEKRQSTFIYPAIVICVGSEKHWFSSFPKRDSVYNLIELFWREALISASYKSPRTSKNTGNSLLGRELLSLLYESENTLIGAANSLIDQSRQLHDAQEAVEDVNDDLNKVEKSLEKISKPAILTGMNALSSNSSKESKNNQESQVELKIKRYKVTFSFSKTAVSDDWVKGTLVIANDIALQDEDGNMKLRIPGNEIESFQIISPWELSISQISNVEKKFCYMMCPQLSRLLKHISTVPDFNEKIIYVNDDTSLYETASSSSTSSFGSALSSPSTSSKNPISKLSDSNSEQIQEYSVGISQDDIEEISNVLNNIQALAAEVNKEQQDQIEKITNLISDVDNTELRIKDDNKKIKKMI